MGAGLSLLYGIPIGVCMALMLAVPLSKEDYSHYSNCDLCLFGSVLGILVLGIVDLFVVEGRITLISCICALVAFYPLLILFKYLRGAMKKELYSMTPRRDAVFGYIRKFGMKIPDELAMICLEYYGKKMEFTVGSYCYCDYNTNYVVVTEVLGNETFRILDLFEESECPSKVVCGHNLSLIKDDSKLRIAKQQHQDYQASMYAEIQMQLCNALEEPVVSISAA